MDEQYKKLRLIGKGTYANVFEGIDTVYKRKVAIKQSKIPRNDGIPATTIREINVLNNLNHENILKLFDVISTENEMFLILEFFEYDLKSYTQNVVCFDYIDIFRQIADGLEYIHSNQIIHRDIKPQNILVNNQGRVVIADFGLSRSIEIEMPSYSTDVVSLWYRAPEILMGSSKYIYNIDIWSLGCVFYETITGEVLFSSDSEESQLILMKNEKEYLYHIEKKLKKMKTKENIITIILGCLIKNPTKRIKINTISELLCLE